MSLIVKESSLEKMEYAHLSVHVIRVSITLLTFVIMRFIFDRSEYDSHILKRI